MRSKSAIVGVAESDLGVTNKSALQLIGQAASAACADAAIPLHSIDGLFTNGTGRFPSTQVAEYLGLHPRVSDSSMMGGSTYGSFVGHAASAIAAGVCEYALIVYGSDQRSQKGTRTLATVTSPSLPDAQFEVPYGPLSPISAYALAAQRHMYEFGTTPEQLAEVAIAARQWARLNPAAYMHDAAELTVDDVLGSPLVSTPLHRLDCCLVTDGGGAVVLTSADRARSLRPDPVIVEGWGETLSHSSIAQMPDLHSSKARESVRTALTMAGLELTDIDLFEVYDSFTITVLLTIEALGLCGVGESGAFVGEGRIRPGGDLAFNTSGGGLSYCHPGMFGIFLLIEAVRQLRGEAAARQVAGVRTALCQGTGGILSSHSTVVMSVQP